MRNNKKIEGDSTSILSKVIGTFEGECADSNITNKNGLDITREVWETVFESEEYKDGIDNGWYIGFLGHPEDPNCMNFKDACIVMTEGHIDDDGKVYGKFNLIDTPVGRIVKTFQDSGVQFGISVRGAGDIIDNSVEPDSFVFRGFDLVSFPAYPESIPTFTEIAASSDVEAKKKYKAISAAIKANIDALDTEESIEILQPHFAKQSEEYKLLEDKKCELSECEDEDINEERVAGLTDLYIEERKEIKKLEKENEILKDQLLSENVTASKKVKSMKRILGSQIKDMMVENNEMKRNLKKVEASKSSIKSRLVTARKQLKSEKKKNLKYIQRIEATSKELDDKEKIIASLHDEIGETVANVSASEKKASNLDVKIKKLNEEIRACHKLIEDYQDAYGNLYANMLGVHLEGLTITSSTNVDELKSMIKDSSSRQKIYGSDNTESESVQDIDIYQDDDSESDMVVL